MDKKTRKLMKKLSQISQLNNPNENTVNCDYYDLNGFKKVIVTKQDSAVLHLSISLLCFHLNKLKLLLSSLNLKFDIICISESRITKFNLSTSNIHIVIKTLSKYPQNLMKVVHWFIYFKTFLTKTGLTSKYTALNIWNPPSLKSFLQISPAV